MLQLLERYIGIRVIKTGLAVFLTSTICLFFDLPAVFAVITAIVTIEPTVQDSIKKGLVRFPASAIGSFYAVTFISLLGVSPLTFTGASVLTIITCYKLKLYDGLLVATLTSVAMISVIHDAYFHAFFVRLLTTSIGLGISTLVNLFILPPNYVKQIDRTITSVLALAGEDLKQFAYALNAHHLDRFQKQADDLFSRYHKNVATIERLVHYQKSESRFHRKHYQLKTDIMLEEKQLQLLKLIQYHIGNLNASAPSSVAWEEADVENIVAITEQLAGYLTGTIVFDLTDHQTYLNQLHLQFAKSAKQEMNSTYYFHKETVILYELISLYQLTEEYFNSEEIRD